MTQTPGWSLHGGLEPVPSPESLSRIPKHENHVARYGLVGIGTGQPNGPTAGYRLLQAGRRRKDGHRLYMAVAAEIVTKCPKILLAFDSSIV